jgi:hypothetical protein
MMEKHHKTNSRLFIAVALISLTIAGCAGQVGNVTSTATASPSATISFTPTPIELTPVGTPLPLETAQEKYLELLSTNGGCKLPCFWGITPGVSNTQDAIKTLSSISTLSGMSSLNSESGYSFFDLYDDENDLSTYVSYSTSSSQLNTVIGINVVIHEFNNLQITFGKSIETRLYDELIYPYTINIILSEFGKPAVVQISTSSFDTDQYWQFFILLIYPEDGVLIQYTIPLKKYQSNIFGCPKDAHIEMRLFPSGDSEQFTQLLSATDWERFWPPSKNNQPGCPSTRPRT